MADSRHWRDGGFAIGCAAGINFFFVLTPILNTFTRTQEHAADMYGINASRQPDGFAQAAIHLGEYREMSPGRLKNGSSTTIPAGADEFMMPWLGKRRT